MAGGSEPVEGRHFASVEALEAEGARSAPAVRTPAGRRRRTGTVAILLAVVFAVAGLTVIGDSLLGPSRPCTYPPYGDAGLEVTREITNWSVVIASFPKLPPSAVGLRILNYDHTPILNATHWSEFTAGNWATYHVLFDDRHPGVPEVCPGDRLVIDGSRYDYGCKIEVYIDYTGGSYYGGGAFLG